MSRSPLSLTTDSRALNAVEMIRMACAATDPIKRAQLLAEAQPQLAWALRSAVEECQEAKLPWTQVGDGIGLPRETVFRQWQSGGPIVTVRASQVKNTASSTSTPLATVDAIFAVQTEDDRWWGPKDAFPSGEFVTAMLSFQPANDKVNRFTGQLLRVRIGRCAQDVSFHSAQVRLADGERRVRMTQEVLNLLFEDGETPLRRALTQVVHATVGNPAVGAAFRETVERAATAQAQSVSAAGESRIPTSEFIHAVLAIIEEWRADPDGVDVYADQAVRRLEQVVDDYESWRQAAR